MLHLVQCNKIVICVHSVKPSSPNFFSVTALVELAAETVARYFNCEEIDSLESSTNQRYQAQSQKIDEELWKKVKLYSFQSLMLQYTWLYIVGAFKTNELSVYNTFENLSLWC